MSEEKAPTPSMDEKRGSVATDSVDFGGELSLPPPPSLTEEEERKLWRKVDLRLMPILSLMYLLSFMDRGALLAILGNAKLQGLATQLDLTGNRYNIALTMYFIPYCLFECPANLVLKQFHPSRWLPGITIAWGIVMTLMGLVKNYPQLVGVRVCLGVAEAGLFPGVVYYLSLWYPRHKLQVRIGLFFGAASLAGAFSGLLAFAISFMSGTRGLLGWSWIFILEGIATVIVGILAAFILVDFPSTAKFLTPEERAYIVHKKKYDNSSVGEEEHFEMRHLWAAMTDWQVWLQILIYMSIIGPLYGITLFLPTIIKSFGHTAAISQLLTVPPYVVATMILYAFAYYSDKIKMRSPFIILGLTFCLIGFSINISDVSNGVKYFGTFFVVAGSYAAFPGVVAWLGNNLAGQYKRGIGMAMQIGIGNFSGAIASNIYRSQDAPRFLVGHGCELMFVGIGFVTVPIAVLAYIHINNKRDAAQKEALERGETNKYTPQQLREMGDRAPDFRYTL
ncbi:MFS general substrate transporter [Gymnopilus junonius]|uniref:MFS general substrate transporter n=1 Tax=Gymnopilus junonius TaxID=109634 RepID=A0A9P5TJQ8_GYMJU|nr:MFS general substrate transporter [Gymnopilus junonius]